MIHKIAVDRRNLRLCDLGMEHQFFVDCVFILLLGDPPLVEHLPEDVLLTILVVLRIEQRIIIGRVVGNRDDRRTLSERKVRKVLGEIGVCRRFGAVGVIGEKHHIEIGGDNLLLGIVLLELEGAENLLHLALDAVVIIAGDIFNQLLGDSRATERGA